MLPQRILLHDTDREVRLKPALRVDIVIDGFPEPPLNMRVTPSVDSSPAGKVDELTRHRLRQPKWELIHGRTEGFVVTPGQDTSARLPDRGRRWQHTPLGEARAWFHDRKAKGRTRAIGVFSNPNLVRARRVEAASPAADRDTNRRYQNT